jgi:hypothetical protein
VSAILSSDKPILLVHKTHQLARRLPEVVQVLRRDVGGDVRFGVAANLPNQPFDKGQRFLDQFAGLDLRVVDPILHARHDQLGSKSKTPYTFPYMSDPWPSQPDYGLILDLFGQQRDLGATPLLSPTGWVSAADPERQLSAAFEWIRAARDLEPDASMLVNLTLDRAWLRSPRLRARLLEEMVESAERLWYLRVRWAVIKPPYSQQRDEDLLQGYADLGQVARAEGKTVIYPTSGLTGWLATGLGATGLGSGTSPCAQGFADEADVRRPKGRTQRRLERYFEPSLLHVVDLTAHSALLGRPGYLTCDCPFCDELDAANPNLDPTTWNAEAAALHYLVQLGRLLAKLHVADPRAEARKEVERALDFRATVSGTLIGNNRPQHLAAWDQVLQ